ncbi:MAG: hypothetical protein AAGF74_11150 [Pseudomonadota bacterium]
MITAIWNRAVWLGVLAACHWGTVAPAQNISSREAVDTTANLGLPREADGRRADLLSAFHGLDALPLLSNMICRGSRGYGGMPVIFSTEIDLETMQAGDFRVVRHSGEVGTLHCVSVLPATDPGELRTVLLIGDLGPSDADPPVSVEIVGHLQSRGGTLDFKGASVAVTPLADGPTLILAEPVKDWTLVGTLGPRRVRGSLCPEDGTLQAARVTWAGGVTREDGSEAGDAERDLYVVTVEGPDSTRRDITPAALANLGDGDNNHMLCLETTDRPVSVAFPAGFLADPNKDLNPATRVEVTPSR